MEIRDIVKTLFTPIVCLRWGIRHHGRYLYIGTGCKLVNARHMRFSERVSIRPNTTMFCHESTSSMTIGKNVRIGPSARVSCLNAVSIGDNVLIGQHVFISDHNHAYEDIDRPIMFQGTAVSPSHEHPEGGVYIGDDSWIGVNVAIIGTVFIGKHCVIGANSVVTKDIPDYSVAAGIPCRVIKRYNFDTSKWERVHHGS